MNNHITSLIIDDEPDARDGLEVLIKTYLPEVEVLDKAADAEEAIRQVVKHEPDLIFPDIKLAVFDFILKPVDPDELIKAIARFNNIKDKESLKAKLDKLTCFLEAKHVKFSTQKRI